MTQLEKEIEGKLRAAVEKRGGKCLKWVCPGWRGVPDRIILLPRGRIIFCELKRPRGGRVEPLQEWWAGQLIELGFMYLRIRNEEELKFFEKEVLDR